MIVMDNNTNFNITKENEFLRKMLAESLEISKGWQKTVRIISISAIVVIALTFASISIAFLKYAYSSDADTNTNINTNINKNE